MSPARQSRRAIFVHCRFGRVTLEMLAKFVEFLPGSERGASLARNDGTSFDGGRLSSWKEISMALQTVEPGAGAHDGVRNQMRQMCASSSFI